MKSWEPVGVENSLINGRPARQEPGLWRTLNWARAEYAVMGGQRVLRVPGRGRLRHTVSACRQELGPGDRVIPVGVPVFHELPAISPTGFVWLLGDAEGAGARTGAERLFGDLIGG